MSSISVAGSADGDRQSDFDVIFHAEFPRLVVYGMSFGLARHAAEDLVQEAFVQLHRHWESVDFPSAYLRRVVFRLAIKRPREVPQSDTGNDQVSTLPGTPDVEARIIALAALSQLPTRQQAVFALWLDGYCAAEIGEILDMHKDTVRSNLRHARQTLGPWWEKIEQEDPG